MGDFLKKKSKGIFLVLILVFIGCLSNLVLAKLVPETKFFVESQERIEDSKATVEELTVTSLSTSTLITFLPDDIGSPIAEVIADLNKYFVFIMMTLYIEEIIVHEGVSIALRWIIPIACGMGVIGMLFKNGIIRSLAKRIAILAIAIVLVVPCGTKIAEVLGAEYLERVRVEIGANNQFIEQNKDEEIYQNKSAFEKLASSIDGVSKKAKDYLEYYKKNVNNFIDSIAILIITSCVIPIVLFMFLVWLMKQLFGIQGPMSWIDANKRIEKKAEDA